ncbi:MAG: ATP-binding protein, partial [Acidiferrobacterales bacterium]
VPEHERERIFEPFYRSSGTGGHGDGGVGLGLALVRQIARHHGGKARCLSREGGGSCFEVELRTGS